MFILMRILKIKKKNYGVHVHSVEWQEDREEIINIVDHNVDHNISCIPCRHILCILKEKYLNGILGNYIGNWWTKLATSKPISDVDGKILEGCSKSKNESQLRHVITYFLVCMRSDSPSKKLLLLVNGATNI